MKEAVLYRKLKNKDVKCLACRWYCKIKEGATGICGVRQNIEGKLYLLVYGMASAVNVDPIEKKPLFHFLPGTKILSVGTVGCNFGCRFCQNWSISQATKNLRERLSKEKAITGAHPEIGKLGYKMPPKMIVDYCVEHQINSIAFTYNEPAIFFEYVYDTAKLAKKKGLKIVLVSNGYFSREAMRKLSGLVDAVNIDLKSFSEEFYKSVCQARLNPVLENIKEFHKEGVWVEITTLVIPGQNDSDKELTAIAKFIRSVSPSMPWHVSAFHPDYKMAECGATPAESLNRACTTGRKAGLSYAYSGNVPDEKNEDSYCPKCRALLIRRRGFDVEFRDFNNGKCLKCGRKIEGVWR